MSDISEQGNPLNWFSPHQKALLSNMSYVDLALLVRHCKTFDEDVNAEIERLKALVTELCDALEQEFGDLDHRPALKDKHPWNLIERAREAIK